MERRVVITGLGIISPVGNDVATFWDSLRNGVCGIESITDFPTEQLPVKIGGRIKDFNPDLYGIDKPFMRKQDWFTIYGVAAAYQAMADSGLLSSGENPNIDPFRLGVYVGSGIGGFNVQIREIGKFIEDPSGQWISPLFVPTMIPNIAAGNIAIRHNATGPCIDVSTACATSTNVIGEAFRAVKHGYADAIIAGGTDQCTIPIGLAAFANAKALTQSEDPKYASLPFNANRAGFVSADGAGVLILEEYGHAKARGARIYAEMVGYGSTCDAYHMTAPRPDGSTQAESISIAIRESGFDRDKDNVYMLRHIGYDLGPDLRPKCEIDFLSRLSVLLPASTKVYAYYQYNTDGNLENRQILIKTDKAPRLVLDPDTGIVKVVGGREARKDVDYEEIRDIQFLEDMRDPRSSLLDEPLDSDAILGPESVGAKEAAEKADERNGDKSLLEGF